MHQLRNRSSTRAISSSAEEILAFLSERQFVRPHRPLADVLGELRQSLGTCEVAMTRASTWLELSGETAIGRLRRTELTQLSRSIDRFWRAARNQPAET